MRIWPSGRGPLPFPGESDAPDAIRSRSLKGLSLPGRHCVLRPPAAECDDGMRSSITVLMSDQGGLLWQMASFGSHGHRVSRAIDWLKSNFAAPLRVEELAAGVQMGASRF